MWVKREEICVINGRRAVDRGIYSITKHCGFFWGELDVPTKIGLQQDPNVSNKI